MTILKLDLDSGRKYYNQLVGYSAGEGGNDAIDNFQAIYLSYDDGDSKIEWHAFLTFDTVGVPLVDYSYAKLKLKLLNKSTDIEWYFVDDIEFGAFTYASVATLGTSAEVAAQWAACTTTAQTPAGFFDAIEANESFELDLSSAIPGSSQTRLVVQLRWAVATAVNDRSGIEFDVQGLFLNDADFTTFVEGDLAKTLGSLTLESDASVVNQPTITGDLDKTLADLVVDSEASVLVTADLAKTLDVLTLVSSNSITRYGTLSKTLDTLSLVSTGILGTLVRVNVTLEDMLIGIEGSVLVISTTDKTLEGLTLVSHGHGPLTLATTNVTLEDASLESEASTEAKGSLTKTLEGLVLSSNSVVYWNRNFGLFQIDDLSLNSPNRKLFVGS